VAGYQGVSYKKEVTTLGRGGSDTTAVALAAALDAEACEIYSDVEGVYTADPRVVPAARRLAELSYEEMQELAEAGARVLNAQAVEFAKERGIAIYARATHGGAGETLVRKLPPRAPGRVVGVTSETGLVLVTAQGASALRPLVEALHDHGASGKEMLLRPGEGATLASVLLSLENLHDFARLKETLRQRLGDGVRVREDVAAVSAIGAGINASLQNLCTALRAVEALGTPLLGASTSSFRITLLMGADAVRESVRRLHRELVTEGEQPLSPAD
jgi:aspartate kinase